MSGNIEKVRFVLINFEQIPRLEIKIPIDKTDYSTFYNAVTNFFIWDDIITDEAARMIVKYRPDLADRLPLPYYSHDHSQSLQELFDREWESYGVDKTEDGCYEIDFGT